MIHRRTPLLLALALAAGLAGAPVAAEGPPIRLFPPVDEPAPPEPRPPPEPAIEPETPPPVEEPEVRVEGLEAPTADAIGLPAPEGLAGGPWRGSDPQVVLALLEDLPVRTANPALRALTRRLLLTPAPRPPEGEEGRLLAARIERLLAMGELDGARALVRRLPPGYGGETAEWRAAETLLLAGEAAAACERAEEGVHRFSSPFWSKLVALCRLRAGDAAEARLAIELLREAAAGGGEADDPMFFALFDFLDAGGSGALELPGAAEPSPLHVALLREAGVPVPGGSLDGLAPGHLAAIARDPTSSPARVVAAAERAAAQGALPPDELAAVYAAADLGDPPGEELSAEAVDRLAATPEGRAGLYRALRAEESATRWAEAAAAVWHAADDPRLRVLLARVFAAPLADLAPEPAAADAAALGLLAAGRPEAARAWSTLAVDPGPLPVLLALAADEEPDPTVLTAWLRTLSAMDGTRLLALFHGLGTPVPESAWRAALAVPPDGDAAPPAAPWLGLRRAVAAERPGEAVLLGLHLLDTRPERAHPVVLADGLEGLRRVGLDAEARAVAVATALTIAARNPRAEAGGGG